MFKKIIPLCGITAALFIAGQANAAVVAVAGTSTISTTNCPALSNTITAQLSNNVSGAYNCDGTSFVAATCATKGTLKLQQVPCQYDASGVLKAGYAGCPADSTAATTYQDTNNSWPQTTPVQSRLGYVGGSGGGQIAANAMGLACDTASLTVLLPDSDLASGTSTSQ